MFTKSPLFFKVLGILLFSIPNPAAVMEKTMS